MKIPFCKSTVGKEEIDAVSRVMASGWMAAGPETEKFEKEFAEYVGCRYAIYTNSGTSALKMSYNILKEMGYDTVAYPKNTFVATYSAASEMGLDICSYGGYDGCICQNQYTNAHNAKQSSKTNTTLIDESSVQLDVTEKVGRVCECHQKQKSNKENVEVQEQSSKGQKSGTQNSQDTTQSISGLKGSMAKLSRVINVVLKKASDGLTTTTNTEGSEKNGKDCATNATTKDTSKSIARVNVHYGSVLDDTPCMLEDSAHRIEKDDKLIGFMRIYSFYVTKNMTTGSGGMFVTDNEEVYNIARKYWKDGINSSTYERQQGKSYNYKIDRLASGYDGNDIGASMGRVQLKRLPSFTKKRNEIVERYNKAFEQTWMGNHLYPVFVKSEEEVHSLIKHLNEAGISTGYHYPGTGWLGVSLPIFPSMTDEEVEYVIEKVNEWNKTTRK